MTELELKRHHCQPATRADEYVGAAQRSNVASLYPGDEPLALSLASVFDQIKEFQAGRRGNGAS